jgi:hypothetical protein
MDDERAELLQADFRNGRLTLKLPEISDYGAVILANEALPVLHPEEKVRYVRCGERVTVRASLANIGSSPLAGSLDLEVPPGWPHPPVSSQPYRIAPGERETLAFTAEVPADAECDTYFLAFATRGLRQRTMLIPADGRPRLIMNGQQPPDPLPPVAKIGAEWVAVRAGAKGELRPGLTTPIDNNEYKNDPGVSFFYNAEWASPKEWKGTMSRRGGRGSLWGGPNFWLNGVDLHSHYEVKLTFWAEAPGALRLWTGRRFDPVGHLPAAQQWQTRTFVLPASRLCDAGGTDNDNALLELDAPEIHVAEIAARKLVQVPR